MLCEVDLLADPDEYKEKGDGLIRLKHHQVVLIPVCSNRDPRE